VPSPIRLSQLAAVTRSRFANTEKAQAVRVNVRVLTAAPRAWPHHARIALSRGPANGIGAGWSLGRESLLKAAPARPPGRQGRAGPVAPTVQPSGRPCSVLAPTRQVTDLASPPREGTPPVLVRGGRPRSDVECSVHVIPASGDLGRESAPPVPLLRRLKGPRPNGPEDGIGCTPRSNDNGGMFPKRGLLQTPAHHGAGGGRRRQRAGGP
jgi:hypothetical protein